MEAHIERMREKKRRGKEGEEEEEERLAVTGNREIDQWHLGCSTTTTAPEADDNP